MGNTGSVGNCRPTGAFVERSGPMQRMEDIGAFVPMPDGRFQFVTRGPIRPPPVPIILSDDDDSEDDRPIAKYARSTPQDTLNNQLAPYVPPTTFSFVLTGHEIFPPPYDPYALCGFKTKSAQHNFFLRDPPRGATQFACLICSADTKPSSFEDPHVVAFCFGLSRRSRGGNEFEIWQVGASATHPYNNAGRGTRWGVFPLTPAASDSSRWTSGGISVTRNNHEHLLRGSPNPFACMALVGAVLASSADTAYQNQTLPCAKPFADSYNHRTQPGMTMIYRALGFQYERTGERYINLHAREIGSRMDRVLRLMGLGQPAV